MTVIGTTEQTNTFLRSYKYLFAEFVQSQESSHDNGAKRSSGIYIMYFEYF